MDSINSPQKLDQHGNNDELWHDNAKAIFATVWERPNSIKL